MFKDLANSFLLLVPKKRREGLNELLHCGALYAVGLEAKFKGEIFYVKFNIQGCIITTRNLENQCQNPHRAICSPAISLRVQPLQEIWSDFAYFTGVTKMPLAPSNMNGF